MKSGAIAFTKGGKVNNTLNSATLPTFFKVRYKPFCTHPQCKLGSGSTVPAEAGGRRRCSGGGGGGSAAGPTGPGPEFKVRFSPDDVCAPHWLPLA